MKYSRIIGTGSYLPKKVITNQDLEKKIDTSDEWITSRTGIKQRNIVEDENTCDLGYQASIKALEMAKISVDELDMIIFATTTPDKIFPSTASLLQEKLGSSCPVFDLQAVCAGFIYALTTADQYIKSGMMKTILVVGSETLSKVVDWNDRNTAVLFGDGAGAFVLTADEKTGIKHCKLLADSTYSKSLFVDNQGINQQGFINMTGQDVFKLAVSELSKIAVETLKESDVSYDELDWMVPHQANIRIIQAVAKKIKQSMDKVIVTVDKHGNTSAASIPLAFDEGVRSGKIKKGDLCLLEGIGAGFAWGSVLLEF
ncbi:3-oxoacyl-[acyl-carrier-protein] synthase, KASIII [hydrothermal vent metagenome]|uniref:beta-ketoacyl-[acyl-carrier-protein] synthase III n=1 Tax=hydrothermal vent metagenome TaxID=652676 RepID=A0A1W1CQV0_9ZZZZ